MGQCGRNQGTMEGPLSSCLISSNKGANRPGRSPSLGNEVVLQALSVKYYVNSHRVDCPLLKLLESFKKTLLLLLLLFSGIQNNVIVAHLHPSQSDNPPAPIYHPSDITHSYCNTTDYNTNKNIFIFTEFLLWYMQFLWFRCIILFKFWNNLMSWVLCLRSFLWMNRLRHDEVKELDQSLLIREELGSESRLFDSRVPLFINILCHLFAVGKLGNRRINSFQDRRSMFFNFSLSRPTEGSQWFFK